LGGLFGSGRGGPSYSDAFVKEAALSAEPAAVHVAGGRFVG